MPGLLKIKDLQSSIAEGWKEFQHLAFDVSDLLALVKNEGAAWAWALFPMGEPTEISGAELPNEMPFMGMTVWEFSGQISEAENGILLSWEQLHSFATTVHQTVWGTYIACAEETSFSRLKALSLDGWGYVDRATEEYYRLTEVVFQAVDSSFWLIYARDDAILHRIASVFGDVETLRIW